jgi:type II secretory pathway predicted ATPase ExeA
MWIRHWGLTHDPFADLGSPYVSLPSHDEAISQLVYAVESSQPRVVVHGAAGAGKTTVLREAIRLIRGPRRRIVAVNEAPASAGLLVRLAARLGARPSRESSLGEHWRTLERAIRICCLEGFHVILAIDDIQQQSGSAEDLVQVLARISRLGSRGLTIVEIHRDDPDNSVINHDPWLPRARLKALTQSEAEDFLLRKLAAAGCRERVFTPRAITRLQSLCSGVPRGLERLATLSLTVGAIRGIEVVSPDIVDDIARQWLPHAQ